jgi:structural maintenance of chromosome 1
LSDLIHGAPIGKPVSNRASVSFVYSYEDLSKKQNDSDSDQSDKSDDSSEIGKEVKFTRTVHGSTSEYRCDGKVTNSVDYQNELEKIGIYLKAKNFLVYQGQVESIAIKNAKEITLVFEEISRSIELKEEYEKLKVEMTKAELETQTNFQKKRGVAAQKKEAKMEKEEAEKYHKMKCDLREQELQMRLFQLYYNEKATEDIAHELEKRQSDFKAFDSKRDKIEAQLKQVKQSQAHETREIAKCEEQIKDYELKLTKKRPLFIKAKESSTHISKKLQTAKTNYEAALKANQTHLSQMKLIEDELAQCQIERDTFEKEIENESLSQGTSLELRESQMKEYHHLKESAAAQSAKVKEKLDTLQREQKIDQDAFDNETRKRNDSSLKMKQKQSELDENTLKLSKLCEYINNTDAQVNEQKLLEAKMSTEIGTASASSKRVEQELAKVMSELGDARIDKFESTRNQKKQEIIDLLKKKFGAGVFGRLIDHCEPVHRKYQVAITKVMGKSMDAIVVDTEKTARECIQFMKEQHLHVETFYPLDYIDAAYLDERLREIREPRNTKVLFDVIKFTPPQIKKALMFAVGNCLVCESDEDARNLAFNGGERHKVVSFDGTLFQKSGLISGGSTDLKQKAKRWDEKHLDALRKKKEDLTVQYKEFLALRRREPELIDLRSNIKALESRLKYSKQNKDTSEQKTISNLEKEVATLEKESHLYDPRISEISARIQERSLQLKKLKVESNQIEDVIYAEFCAQIGVVNIRLYEDRELAGQQERLKERMAFQEKQTRLKTQLEFEKSRDTKKAYDKWQRDLKDNETELEKLKQAEESLLDEIKKIEQLIEQKRADTELNREESTKLENEINEQKKKLTTHNKETNDFRKKINSTEARMLDKKLERHAILKNSKIELVRLPMIHGRMEDIADDQEITQTTQTTATTTNSAATNSVTHTESLNSISTADQTVLIEKESRIKIDYKKLDTKYLNLESCEEIDTEEARIASRLSDIRQVLHNFQTPNNRADEKLDTVTEMWESTTAEFDKARMVAKKARAAFVKIKQERYDRFMKCFDFINSRIDDIYKSLCMNQGAQASLVLENVEEPYSEGIIYNCVAPGKRFRQMDNLSGGEKTVAALGLLFAIRSFNPSPFFVLD